MNEAYLPPAYMENVSPYDWGRFLSHLVKLATVMGFLSLSQNMIQERFEVWSEKEKLLEQFKFRPENEEESW